MALGFLNRCMFRAASGGTGAFAVASAITGFRVPADCANPAVADNGTYRYIAESDDKTQWEIGYGVYTAGDTTLNRAVILDSSNAGSVVTFSAAPKVRMGGPVAGDMPLRKIHDETISSPTAQISIGVTTTNLIGLRVAITGLTAAMSSNPVSAGAYFDGTNVVFGFASLFTWDEDTYSLHADVSVGASDVVGHFIEKISGSSPAQTVYAADEGVSSTLLIEAYDDATPINITAGRISVWGLYAS